MTKLWDNAQRFFNDMKIINQYLNINLNKCTFVESPKADMPK